MTGPAAPHVRPLFHHDGSPAAQAHLEQLVAAAQADPGRELATFRARPTAGFLTALVLPFVLVAVLAAVIAPDPAIAVVPLAIGLGAAAIFVVAGALDRIRVHERALVLGFRGQTAIPLETIDPGRVYVSRALFLTRNVAAPAGATRGTAGPMVVVNGWQRSMLSANVAGAPDPGRSVFGWYLLGARNRRAFLAALEQAMLGQGLTAATGLAQDVLAHRAITPTWSVAHPPLVAPRSTTDPPLGVGPRSRP
ncbi:hypothetical protein SAMN06296429_107123 [Janibacter indicus]|uniref:PH domain-containing protein n=1 Tax=Janibacter indicus TaxID=857417 RepID=A0A1W2B586_9MICO|nr:hypothetical protein SAMN06296429_107123 [Janibacter indicus]